MRKAPGFCSRTPGLLLLALALLAADAAAAAPAYIGKAYRGRVMAEIQDSELPVARQRSGTATAEFTPTTAGKARLTVTGDIRGDSASLSVEGRYDSAGFHGKDATTELTVDPAGRITGRGLDKGSEYRFSGTVSADAMALTILWRPAPGAAETTLRSITFTYTLDSEAALSGKGNGKGPRGKDGKPCRKTRVEQRAFPSFDGGPMTMGMVIVSDD